MKMLPVNRAATGGPSDGDHGKTFKPVTTHTKPTAQTRATSGQYRPVKDA